MGYFISFVLYIFVSFTLLLAALAVLPPFRRLFFGIVWKRLLEGKLTRETAQQRKEIISRIKDGSKVLEIGPGTGSNFKFMPQDKHIVWQGTEPNHYFLDTLKKEAAKYGFDGDKLEVSDKEGAAFMSGLKDETFDYVLVTLVLCSVPDPLPVIEQAKRVLKPGGELLFVEHIAHTPESGYLKYQKLCNPVWGLLFDGCHIDRNTLETLKSAGFSSVHADEFFVRVPGFYQLAGRFLSGYATK